MKRHFISLVICAATVVGALFIVFNPASVSAETNADELVAQTDVNALVTMAMPPYKW